MDQQLLDILLGFRTILTAVLVLQIGTFCFAIYGVIVIVRIQRDMRSDVRDVHSEVQGVAAMTRDVAAMTQEVLRRRP
jgi:hypothetical protein